MMVTAGFPPPEEVVIDGDSTEDEDDVAVVASQSRKRKRASLIADEDDETDDAGDGSNGGQQAAPAAASATPAHRTVQSKLGFAEVRRMERERKDNGEAEDEDDEVVIVGPPVRTTPGSGGSGRKSGRLTIVASDDEQEPEQPQQQRQSGSASRVNGRRSSTTPKAQQQEEKRPRSASSSSRRSTRIEKKRKEKELLNGITRRLDYPVLDNCLDRPARNGEEAKEDDPDYQEDEEDEEDEEDFEVEQEETLTRPKKQQRRETEREVLHADGGEDLDEFIVGDDEIEYMDDDEKGVISVESSESEGEFDAMEEMEAMRAARSRDQSEWFAIYLEYLEESMVDPEMDYKMRRYKNKPHFRTFHEAIRHIERVVCSRRDTLRVNIVWPEELVDAIKNASHLRWERVEPTDDCEACNRSGHLATFRVFYSGVSCDATELYRDGWMERLRGAMKEATPVHERFDMGSTCHSRTLVYWQLLHAKQMLCAIVDAKRRENGNSKGRIPQGLRDEFYKKEYGRFKRLLNLVDRFSTETRQGIAYVPNIWKHVTRKHLESEFLPTPVRNRDASGGENRRGTLDSLVGESEDEEEEDEEEAMEQLKSRRRSSSSAAAAANGASDEEKAPAPSSRSTGMKRAAATQTQPSSSLEVDDEDDKKLVGGAKSEPQDFDDLMCLVCHKRPRDAAVVHGLYLHYYSCYGCAKRQLRAKDGCIVCERPIDRVLRVLPLTPETRRAIENESKASGTAQ